MKLFHTVLLTSGVVLGLCGATEARDAPAGKMITLQMPAQPDPARVSLDPKTTAVMVLDYVQDICNNQPKCKNGMLPAVTPFLAKARQAGVTVAYGTRAQNQTMWLPEIAPKAGDIRVTNTAQDRFYGTDLDKEMKAKGIKTIIMVGWKISGSITYTSVGAMAHGYTVVIPTDTTAATSDYEQTIGFYNVLNSGSANLRNQPLKAGSVTLSRTDMISFQ
ncbi:MAG: isochorismatase family protein [Alphaproteobacteria bacterium]|nr:isochorismatase family protein [Alphaproteobacteria bacterium]